MIAVGAPGLAEADRLASAPYAGLYPGIPLDYRSAGLRSRDPGVFYTLPESAAPAGLRRIKRNPVDPATLTALGIAASVSGIAGLGYSSRGSWNPVSGAFWANRGKTECSRNPFSSAYCGKSNPAKCSRNPLSRRYCGNM